jgi:hypothetical protein
VLFSYLRKVETVRKYRQKEGKQERDQTGNKKTENTENRNTANYETGKSGERMQ